jgi:hypothetical protein
VTTDTGLFQRLWNAVEGVLDRLSDYGDGEVDLTYAEDTVISGDVYAREIAVQPSVTIDFDTGATWYAKRQIINRGLLRPLAASLPPGEPAVSGPAVGTTNVGDFTTGDDDSLGAGGGTANYAGGVGFAPRPTGFYGLLHTPFQFFRALIEGGNPAAPRQPGSSGGADVGATSGAGGAAGGFVRLVSPLINNWDGRIEAIGADGEDAVATAEPDAWAQATAYVGGDIRQPTTPNDFAYQAQNSATSHPSDEPIWPVEPGAEVTDGPDPIPVELIQQATAAVDDDNELILTLPDGPAASGHRLLVVMDMNNGDPTLTIAGGAGTWTELSTSGYSFRAWAGTAIPGDEDVVTLSWTDNRYAVAWVGEWIADGFVWHGLTTGTSAAPEATIYPETGLAVLFAANSVTTDAGPTPAGDFEAIALDAATSTLIRGEPAYWSGALAIDTVGWTLSGSSGWITMVVGIISDVPAKVTWRNVGGIGNAGGGGGGEGGVVLAFCREWIGPDPVVTGGLGGTPIGTGQQGKAGNPGGFAKLEDR